MLNYFFKITGFLLFPNPWDWRIKLHTPYMACDTHTHTHTHTSKKTKGYTTKRRYQQTRRNKQKTLQIMNDQLDKRDNVPLVIYSLYACCISCSLSHSVYNARNNLRTGESHNSEVSVDGALSFLK
jgi:hypothetical protein